MAAAAATAAGVILAAGISARAQNNAAKRAARAQETSTSQGLEYQRGRDARADALQDKKWAAYQDALADYRTRNGGGAAAPAGGGGGGASMGSPVSIADLMGAQQGVADATAAPSGSVADTVGGVFDWKRYGA